MSYEGLFEFAQQVAENLDNWRMLVPQPFSHAACLSGPDGAGLMIGVNGFGGFEPGARIEVSGRWPEAVTVNQNTVTFYPRNESASITAAVKRGPLAVTRDIKRRLLPKYLLLYREMAERKARYIEKEAKRQECLERVALVGGGELGRVPSKVRFDWPRSGWGYAEVNMGDEVTVSLELHSVPFKKALELVRVLER